jgi:glutamine cyclotransferase
MLSDSSHFSKTPKRLNIEIFNLARVVTQMKKLRLIGILVLTAVFLLSLAVVVVLNEKPAGSSTPITYNYEVIKTYPHDPDAFTEGLVFSNNFLYESTGSYGNYGNSSLRRVDLETGQVLQIYHLPDQFFGEGIAIVNNTIVQLTWQSHTGFVYDEESFAILKEFTYPTEGWGLTYDGSQLIMSDGSADLYFLNPQTFARTGQVGVHDNIGPVTNLNELEYINGDIYANIWLQSRIAIINPQTGQVKAWINMTGLQNPPIQDSNSVLNGIAYDANGNRLFVTGKMWPQLFEIKLVPST